MVDRVALERADERSRDCPPIRTDMDRRDLPAQNLRFRVSEQLGHGRVPQLDFPVQAENRGRQRRGDDERRQHLGTSPGRVLSRADGGDVLAQAGNPGEPPILVVAIDMAPADQPGLAGSGEQGALSAPLEGSIGVAGNGAEEASPSGLAAVGRNERVVPVAAEDFRPGPTCQLESVVVDEVDTAVSVYVDADQLNALEQVAQRCIGRGRFAKGPRSCRIQVP